MLDGGAPFFAMNTYVCTFGNQESADLNRRYIREHVNVQVDLRTSIRDLEAA
jgi:hypothetical protein